MYNSNKLKLKRKRASEDTFKQINASDEKLEHKLKSVKSKTRFRNGKNKKLFKEEEFADIDSVDNESLPKRKKNNKEPTIDGHINQFSNDSSTYKVATTSKGLKLKTKKKKVNDIEKKQLIDTVVKDDNIEVKESRSKKSKRNKTIQIENTKNLEHKFKRDGQKKKKRKGKKENLLEDSKNLEDSSTKAETPKVQRTSPNATKFLFINLIKSILQKKLSLSKDKLKKKVFKKFYKIMGVEEKPEFVKDYEKSLMLTYGIEILEDNVKLK